MNRATCFVAFAIAGGTAQAQQAPVQYPLRPIRLVVTFPPGGGTDVLARLLGGQIAEAWGEQVVIDNRPGASGNIGADIVAKSNPDGHTLLMINSSFAINATVYTQLPFDSARDFTPVIMMAWQTPMIAVNVSMPLKSFADLLATARAQPGKLSYSSCGSGTPQHLSGELLKHMAKIDMVHVPYRGCGPAIVDGLGGQVPLLFNTVANTMPHVKAGRLRALAVTSAKRFPLAPELPTVAESGIVGYDVDQWYGVLGPRGVPRAVVDRLHGEIARIVARPDIRERLLAQYFAPTTSTPESFGKTLRADIDRWGALVKAAGIKAD
jgi:tripartite-type tricarboxylate transporter receptor subunit TctC